MLPADPPGRSGVTDLPRTGTPAQRALAGAGITMLEALARYREALQHGAEGVGNIQGLTFRAH